jgi:hypothetical protein
VLKELQMFRVHKVIQELKVIQVLKEV